MLLGSSRDLESHERKVVRLGLPSKGRMADETLSLLKVPTFPLLGLTPSLFDSSIFQSCLTEFSLLFLELPVVCKAT